MKPAPSLRDRLRTQLADLRIPGALEALDEILAALDGGPLEAPAAIEVLLAAVVATLPALVESNHVARRG